jgi:hypothetical protein
MTTATPRRRGLLEHCIAHYVRFMSGCSTGRAFRVRGAYGLSFGSRLAGQLLGFRPEAFARHR